MSDERRKPFARFLRRLKHPALLFTSERRETFADIIRRASQLQTLEELTERVAADLCAALDLQSIHLFALHTGGNGRDVYRLVETSVEASGPPMEFAASSATVLRMRRESKPTAYDGGEGSGVREGWQLLAGADELEKLTQLGAQLLFPLAGRTGLMGFVALERRGRRPFSRAEERFLYRLGRPLGSGLETALLLRRLTSQAVERERSAQDLALARDVQAHLLPQALPAQAGLTFAAFYQSLGEVGGDYYDVLPAPGGKLCIVVGDVSGKGIAAALLMAALRAALQTLMAATDLSAAQLVARLNDILYQSSSAGQYATLFLCLYDPAGETIEYCNAGHVPPLLLRPRGEIVRLVEGGTVVGLLPHPAFENGTATFTGSILVAYTDGISEATNHALDEWTEQGVQDAALSAVMREPEVVLTTIRSSLEQFVGTATQADDMTLVVIASSGSDRG